MRRTAARIDSNQPDIVKALRKLGFTVELNHDDILVGSRGRTYWYEIKTPDTVSKKKGTVKLSQLKDSQKKLLATWKGHYKVVWTLDQILEDINRH